MNERTDPISQERISLFRDLFGGRSDVYGTYDPRSGRVFQVKQPVTDDVIRAHLFGRRPYGAYLLVDDRTRAVAADFDDNDVQPVFEFVQAAGHYGLCVYIERSKSKGFHAWVFFDDPASARKARLVMRHVLEEIGRPNTEVFPKHDRTGVGARFGNFINAPLFGGLVPQGRTVFINPTDPDKVIADQWTILQNIRRVRESLLDDIIDISNLDTETNVATSAHPTITRSMAPTRVAAENSTCVALTSTAAPNRSDPVSPAQHPEGRFITYGLPPCARRMLAEGVTTDQRVACFRLAVNLKRTGLPMESAVAVLKNWSMRNRPTHGRRIITDQEILAQIQGAFSKDYRAYGCEEPAVSRFCDPACRVKQTDIPTSRREGTQPMNPPGPGETSGT